MVYYLYEIRNLVNGKIYVGVHKTDNVDDGYMGSGKVIRQAIKKYGLANFQKTILRSFDTAEAAYAGEKEVVTEEFLLRKDVYNVRVGGRGGFDWINRRGLNDRTGYRFSEQQKQKISISRKHAVTDEARRKSGEMARKNLHTSDSRAKMKASLTGQVKSQAHREKIRQSIIDWHKRKNAGLV